MKYTPAQLRQQAYELRAGQDPNGEIRICIALLQRHPEDYRSRMQLADALVNIGAPEAGIPVYRAVAEQCTLSGRPLRAMVACRVLEALGQPTAEEVSRLCQLYAAESPSLSHRGTFISANQTPICAIDDAELNRSVAPAQLISLATQVGTDLDRLPELPCKFRPIPLFSQLAPSRMAAVIATATVHRLPPGHIVFRQGSMGKSCFLVASGAIDVSVRHREDDASAVIASLSDGGIVGEMALITNSPRCATATTAEHADLLELGPSALAAIGSDLPRVAAALDALAQQRWLANLKQQSPLFKVFDERERTQLLQRFKANEVAAGTVLLPQGQMPEQMYLILRGEIGMVRRADNRPTTVVSRAYPGSTLGLEQLIARRPCTESATALTTATVLFLSATEVLRLVEAVPELATAIRDSALSL